MDGSQILPEQAKISTYFNLDNGAGKIRGLYLMGNREMEAPLRTHLAPFPASQTLTLQQANQSDHELFDWMGVPAFQFIQDPMSYISVTHHTNMDYQEYFPMENPLYNALLVAYLSLEVANQSGLLPRKPYEAPYPILDGKTTIRLEGD